MKLSIHLAILLTFALAATSLNAADQSADASAKLSAMVTATSLDAPDMTPWHWTMNVTIYDSAGKSPQLCTIEVWFADGNMRTVMTFGDSELTTLRLGDKLYRTGPDDPKFVPLEMVFMNALRPVPDGLLKSGVSLKLRAQTVGKTKLSCIEPTIALPAANTFYVGAPLSYCSDEGRNEFRVAFEPSQTIIQRTQIGTFLSKQVPVALQVSAFSKKRAEMTTTFLATFKPSPDDFAILPAMQEVTGPVAISATDHFLGLILNHDAPHYPADARARHVEGSVKFDVIIGADGRILAAQLTNQADSELINAAREVLTRWVYRPFLINGIPVQVKTTLIINFNLA